MWIRQLLPYPSLQSFTLNAHSVQGHTYVPRGFITSLASMHKATLKEFVVNSTAELTLEDIKYICTMFSELEHLACSVASPHVNAIRQVIENGRNLRSLRLHVIWIPDTGPLTFKVDEKDRNSMSWGDVKEAERFTVAEAMEIMLSNDSRIRLIGIGPDVYMGHWVRRLTADGSTELAFEVLKDLVPDRWG
jgi:hypothetical protein